MDWNGARVAWREYEAGFAEALEIGKPVLLIFYTDWCPHCHNYSRLFHVPEVIELAASFVMIRVERDGHPALSARHAPDGNYIPRTFFFDPAGAPWADLISDNPEYMYFFDEHHPEELIEVMTRARTRAAQWPDPSAPAR
jgi:thiol-disulfide isomerase/thioredoxin